MSKKKKKKKPDPRRASLIRQLRYALYLAESPKEICIEFDILETTFELEFDEEVK